MDKGMYIETDPTSYSKHVFCFPGSDWLSQLTTADGEQLQFDPSLLEEDNGDNVKEDKRWNGNCLALPMYMKATMPQMIMTIIVQRLLL